MTASLPPAPDRERCERLERRVDRERRARVEAEALLEQKSRALYEANRALQGLTQDLEARVETRTRELAAAREETLALAGSDALTGLASRAGFARLLAAAVRSNAAFCLLALNIDRFKAINEASGQEAGDHVLRHVGLVLRGCCGPAASLARLGGDEFAALVPVATETDAAALARTIVAAVSRPISVRGQVIEASCSIGIARYPDDAGEGEELLRFADTALHRAKVERGTHAHFTPQMGRELSERRRLGIGLRRALDGGEIVPWFQPIVGASTGLPVSAETLVRWRHPTRGLIPPSAFLGVAEDLGLMPQLTQVVLRAACRAGRPWVEAGLIGSLAVNMSPSQFRRGDLAADVHAILAETGFPPGALTIEITEEVLVDDLDRARSQLERVAATGVRIALDDFGIGYSNIVYLRQLPIHAIKLDRQLTADVVSDAKSRRVLGAIIEIAKALDLTLVAEGVETPGQALWLTQLGCPKLQGWYFGRPMAADAFERAALEARAARCPEIRPAGLGRT